jgi:hypothetical protein
VVATNAAPPQSPPRSSSATGAASAASSSTASGVAQQTSAAGVGSTASAGPSVNTGSSATTPRADGTATAGSGTVAEITAQLRALGLSPSEVAALLAKLQAAKAAKSSTTDTTTTATDPQAAATAATLNAGVPQAGALPFLADPVTILSAAEQAIAAVTGQSATGSAQATAQAQVTAVQTATAAATPVPTTTAATSAAAALAQQGVISINGQLVAAGAAQQTVSAAVTATQASATSTQAANTPTADASQVAASVAAAAIRQASGNVPMSRMSEIRAKLQAAQLGAGSSTSGKSAGVLTAATAEANPDSITATPTTATAAAATQLTALADKLVQAVSGAQSSVGEPIDKASSDTGVSADTASHDPTATLDPSLAGIGQNASQQAQVADPSTASATTQAVPLTALASTLVAHAKAGDSEFNIRLDPAGLGQIDVKMKVSSDGEVRAHLIVDQPATLDLMMRDRQQLQQQLDQAGFKTDGSSLQFSLKDQGQGQQQANQGQQSQPSTASQSADTVLTPVQSAVYARQSYVRSDGVDLSV